MASSQEINLIMIVWCIGGGILKVPAPVEHDGNERYLHIHRGYLPVFLPPSIARAPIYDI